jgi:hypothetical protein
MTYPPSLRWRSVAILGRAVAIKVDQMIHAQTPVNHPLVVRSGGPNTVVLVGVDEIASRESRNDAIKRQGR